MPEYHRTIVIDELQDSAEGKSRHLINRFNGNAYRLII